MTTLKKYLVISFVGIASLLYSNRAHSQLFFLGIEGGATYSWFNSPKFENIITSDGWGWNLGFFARYGKKTYLQLGFDWTRSKNDFRIDFEGFHFDEQIKFHNFDFSIKYGYNFFYRPMFKLKVQAGPFIGRSFLFSGDELEFTNDDFKNPQWGIIGGLGFQFMNFVADIEYSYHFTDLFEPIVVGDQEIKFGSNLQMIIIKIGFMF
jgi:hypothetical protein